MDGEKQIPKGLSNSIHCELCNVFVPINCESSHKNGKRHRLLEDIKKKKKARAACTIRVLKLPSYFSQLEISDYFSHFGPVSKTTLLKNKAFVEFARPVAELGILNKKHLLRGKEINVVQDDIQSQNLNKPTPFPSPVDITKNQQIIKNLDDNSSFENQLEMFLQSISLPQNEVQRRQELVNSLAYALQEFFPECRLEIFGSTGSGYGFAGCDVDISFFLPFQRDESQVMLLGKQDVPTPRDVQSGRFSRENLLYLSKENILFFISKYLARWPGVKFVRVIPSVRCPIVKFQKNDICGDISFCKSLGVANTRLLRLYGQLDFHIYALLMVLRFWGKREQLIGSNHMITSYAFNWLIIFYLQKKLLVPTIETLALLSDHKVEAESWDCTFCEDIKLIPVGLKNSDMDFGSLITGFFEFYAKFDFTVNVICPRDGTVAKKSALIAEAGDQLDFKITSMSVQDVFDLTHNITAAVNDTILQTFLLKCSKQWSYWSAEENKGKFTLKCLFDPGSTRPIIEPSSSKGTLFINLNANKCTVDLETACNFVLDTLKRAFLFECSIVKSSSLVTLNDSCSVTWNEERPRKKLKTSTATSSEEEFILCVNCVVRYRTWQNRKNIKGFVSTGNIQQIEIEEMIAREMVKHTPDASKVSYVFEANFIKCRNTILKVQFIPKTQEKELVNNAIPYIRKYIMKSWQPFFFLNGVKVSD